jgi:conjugal transfer/entry exclusion protein
MAVRSKLTRARRRARFLLVTTALVVVAPAAAYALAVFDAANYAENLATKLKTIEELAYVINTYNEIKTYVTLVGQIKDMADGFVNEPMRLVNEVTNCLNVQTNTPANTLCGKQFEVGRQYFVTTTGGGEVGDAAVTSVRQSRDQGLQGAVQRSVALGRYTRSDTTVAQYLVDLAAKAGSPTSASAQANIQNQLLVEVVRQLQLTNTLLSAQLELNGNQAAQQMPVTLGFSTSRFGTSSP